MENPFAPMEQGLTARQSTHTVHIEETNGNFVQYSMLVDGSVSGVNVNPGDHTVSFKGYTLVNGAVRRGADEWSVDGGIVEFTASAEVVITLDGQQVTGSDLVSSTGGTHPSNIPDTQCSADSDCAGDLLCDNHQCVMPPLDQIPQCHQHADCHGDLVCVSGECQPLEGGGGTSGGGGSTSGNGGSTNGENGGASTQALGGTTALALVVGVLVIAYVYGAV